MIIKVQLYATNGVSTSRRTKIAVFLSRDLDMTVKLNADRPTHGQTDRHHFKHYHPQLAKKSNTAFYKEGVVLLVRSIYAIV